MLKRLLKQNKIAVASSAVVLASSPVMAVDVLGQPITMDVAPVTAMVGAIIVAIAAIWAYKKIIAFGNKS